MRARKILGIKELSVEGERILLLPKRLSKIRTLEGLCHYPTNTMAVVSGS